MIKGGYQIIDFTGISALDGTETLPGAFAKIKSANKPILASNFVGINMFTADMLPADTTKAVLSGIAESNGSLVPIGIVINSDDTVELFS